MSSTLATYIHCYMYFRKYFVCECKSEVHSTQSTTEFSHQFRPFRRSGHSGNNSGRSRNSESECRNSRNSEPEFATKALATPPNSQEHTSLYLGLLDPWPKLQSCVTNDEKSNVSCRLIIVGFFGHILPS